MFLFIENLDFVILDNFQQITSIIRQIVSIRLFLGIRVLFLEVIYQNIIEKLLLTNWLSFFSQYQIFFRVKNIHLSQENIFDINAKSFLSFENFLLKQLLLHLIELRDALEKILEVDWLLNFQELNILHLSLHYGYTLIIFKIEVVFYLKSPLSTIFLWIDWCLHELLKILFNYEFFLLSLIHELDLSWLFLQ